MPVDEEDLSRVFKSIDVGKSGSINSKELREAMVALGVKVSFNSAAKVLAMIDTDGNGTVEWEEFKVFFVTVGNPDEIKKLLSKENQRFFEYKEFVKDPQFARTFIIPPYRPKTSDLKGHSSDIQSVVWCPDTRLVSASIEGDIFVWDGETTEKKPQPLQRIQSKSVYSLALSKDGKRIVTGHGSRTGTLALWDLAESTSDGQESTMALVYEGMNEPVYTCAFSGSNTSIASGTKNGKIYVHDTSNAEPVCSWKGHDSVVTSLRWQPSGDSVVGTSSRDGSVKVFDIRIRDQGVQPQLVIEDAAASECVNQMLWRKDKEIISCGDDYCIKRWDIRKPDAGPLSSFFGHSSAVRAVGMSQDERFLVSGTYCGSVRVWLADELGFVASLEEENQAKLNKLEVEFAKHEALQQSGDGDIEEFRDTIRQQKEVKAEKGTFKRIRDEREKLHCTQAKVGLEGAKTPVNCVAWKDLSDKMACVAVGSQDQVVRLYRFDTSDLATISLWRPEEA